MPIFKLPPVINCNVYCISRNLLLTERNDIKLANFILANIIEKPSSSFEDFRAYMCPEVSVMDSKFYPNSDVWSLGCVLYELIFLKRAFPDEHIRYLKLPSDLSDSGIFSDILSMMLEKDHTIRISSNDLMSELNKIVDELNSNFRQKDNIIDPYIGKIFNEKYEVVKRLGEGACGLVYLVNEKSLKDNQVTSKAIKIMKSEESSTKNELNIFLKIKHENIVVYYEHFDSQISEDNYTFLVTEYCENGDLKNKIKNIKIKKKSFEEDQILKWIRQSTDALNYLHSESIIHRDIKPANMLLTKTNDIKLADLGVAKIMDKTHANTHTGTTLYMSPEIFKSKIDDGIIHYPNTDIWSLGCVLYELIFLEFAFPKGQKGNPALPSKASSSGLFSSILPKMLEKDTKVRITSKELLALLDSLIVADKD